VLSAAPKLEKQNDGYSLFCPVVSSFPRIDAQNLGSDMAQHPDTFDVYADAAGNIARVSGLDHLPQKIQTSLSLQRGESIFHRSAGIRFYEYYQAFRESPWLALLMKLDIVREASIPFADKILKRQYTQLQCVTRVLDFELLSETPAANNRLPVRVTFEVQGVGLWERDLQIYMPTKEQMEKQAKLQAEMEPLFSLVPNKL
jgi:hypothetical protein